MNKKLLTSFVLLVIVLAQDVDPQDPIIEPPIIIDPPIVCPEPQPEPVEIQLYKLPDFLTGTGQASGELQNEQVKVGLTIETLKLKASDSLQANSQGSNLAIASLKKIGLTQSEFATSGISIFPSYQSVYNPNNGTYTQVFEGYKVRNSITISTKKLNLAGKIIDAAVTNGVNNVDYITFSPLDSSVQALREKLLALAVQDAKKEANIVLNEVNYEIKSVKRLNIVNNNYNYPQYEYSKGIAADAAPSTPTFSGKSTVNVSVDVSFIIGKKE